MFGARGGRRTGLTPSSWHVFSGLSKDEAIRRLQGEIQTLELGTDNIGVNLK